MSREIAIWMFENNPDEANIPQKEYKNICDAIKNNMKENEDIERDFMIGNFFKLKHCEGEDGEELYFVHRSIYEYFVVEYIFKSICNVIDLSKEELAGVLGRFLKGNILSPNMLEYIKIMILNSGLKDKFNIINAAFHLMLKDGMTYYCRKHDSYKNIINCEMNVFDNMLEILHLWDNEVLKFGEEVEKYLKYNIDHELNLSKVSMSGVSLMNVYLIKSNLYEINLERINLRGANLQGANLERANLERANLERANLERANLKRANLVEADLLKADLQNADLESANLYRTNLESANLIKVNLEIANLKEAFMYRADLSNASLKKAKLIRANLSQSSLQKTDLKEADLRGAELQETNLSFANLIDASLNQFDTMDIKGAYIQGSKWNESEFLKLLSKLRNNEFEYIIVMKNQKEIRISKKQLFDN